MRRAVELEPADAAVHSNLVYALNFHPGYDAAMVFREHSRTGPRHAEPLSAPRRPHDNGARAERRLRIGYVSAHFREHAVSFFSEPMIAAHDPAQFEIFCYSDVARRDAVTERFRLRALPGATSPAWAKRKWPNRCDKTRSTFWSTWPDTSAAIGCWSLPASRPRCKSLTWAIRTRPACRPWIIV